MPEQFENGTRFDSKNSLQDFDAIERYLVNQSCSKSVENCSIFKIFKCLHDVVSKMCRLEFNFQNLPFSKCACKNVPFSCEREACPSYFSPLSKCVGIV